MYEFKLPDVGEGIHEAEVVRWMVAVGQTVKQDQPILEVQTDKAVVEIPTPVAGVISEIRAETGRVVRVGEVLVVIAAGEQQEKAPAPAGNSQKAQQPAASVKTPGLAGPGRRVLAAPAVRKMALELGLELADVPGSGPAGRVLPQDVERFVEQQEAGDVESAPDMAQQKATRGELGPAVAQEKRAEGPAQQGPPPLAPAPAGRADTIEEPLRGLRRRIAERMELAWRTPQATSFDEIDAAQLVALRAQLKAEAGRRGVRLTYLPLLIKAAVQVLKEFPYFNASLDMAAQKIRVHRHYHIGVAMAVPDGLLVPVIRHAGRMTVLQIAQELDRLAEGAAQRRLSRAELSGGTFSLTNFGSFGGRQGTPIINPPEAAILGCGRIEERAVVIEGQVEVRPRLPLALSYDHRLIDGAAAGAFLERLARLLVDPNLLLLELV